ncbi:MAG: YchJ family metal-binding protein [Chlamydiales bacterium]
MKCPCHSGKEYRACCKPYHNGQSPLKPIALMRARYSAYALKNVDYIIETTHSSHPDQMSSLKEWRSRIFAFSKKYAFINLTILDLEDCFVTFQAQLNHDESFIEKSEFKKEDGEWRYKGAVFIK